MDHGSMHTAASWSWQSTSLMAVVMTACMMPLLSGPAQTILRRNLPGRRLASLAWFAVGYAMFWFVSSFLLRLPLYERNIDLDLGLFAASGLVAVGWQMSPTRLRWMSRCGYVRTTRIRGRLWVSDHLAAGAAFAGRCAQNCWASMLMMVVAPSMIAMFAVAGFMIWEFREGPDPFAARRRTTPALGFSATAVVVIAFQAMTST
ncbi:MAG: DUF2182 domain-containing protein [Aeromicrobium sp.]